MTTLFLDTLNTSLSATWLILAVLALRFLLKKAPKWLNVFLWGLVAFRLICPFSIESHLSQIPDSVSSGDLVSSWTDDYVGSVEIIHESHEAYLPAVQSGRAPVDSVEGGHYVVTAPDKVSEPKTIGTTLIPILSGLWLCGIATMLLYTFISYLRLRRQVRLAIRVKGNVYISEFVSSPFVLGLLKPRIYLPYHMPEPDRTHVIAHERAHIRRRDHWWKPLGFLLLTLHWFNPLMWPAYLLLCRDIEMACDERVIEELSRDQRADYSQALLHCTVTHRSIAACPIAFGEVSVRSRVKNVLTYQKPAFWIILLCLVLMLILSLCFLTDPVGITIEKIVEQDGYYLVRQVPKNINLVIDKAWLPEDCFTLEGHRFEEKAYIPYQASADNILYLKQVRFEDESQEYLCFTFDFVTEDAGTGKLLLPYSINTENGATTGATYGCGILRNEVWDNQQTYPDAAYFRGQGAGEEFSVSVRSDIYEQAGHHIAFQLTGFQELFYEKGSPDLPFGVTYQVEAVTGSLAEKDKQALPEELPLYQLTPDKQLKILENLDSNHWLTAGTLEPFTLSQENFSTYWSRNPNVWVGTTRESILEANEKAWQTFVSPGTSGSRFYYLLRQNSGELYLAMGTWYPESTDSEEPQTYLENLLLLREANCTVSSAEASIQSLAGKVFQVSHTSQVLYAAPQYDSAWQPFGVPYFAVSDTNGSGYSLLTRTSLPITASKEDTPWVHANTLDLTTLTQENFDDLISDPQGKQTAKTLRKENRYAWQAHSLRGSLYILLLQEDGTLYMACGSQELGSANGSLRFIVRLDPCESGSWEVAMTPISITLTSAFLQFHQVGTLPDGTLSYNENYTVEHFTGGIWQEVPPLQENYAFNAIAHVIKTKENSLISFDWSERYGTLPDGQYRVKVDVTLTRAPGDTETKSYYANFTIGTDADPYVFLALEELTPTGMTLRETFLDHSDQIVVHDFWMEVKQGAYWAYYAPTVEIESIFDGVTRNIPYTYHDTVINLAELDWSTLYGQLPAGTYRICRDYTFYGEDTHIRTAYLEFSTAPAWGIDILIDRISENGLTLSFLLDDSISEGEYFYAGASLERRRTNSRWEDILFMEEPSVSFDLTVSPGTSLLWQENLHQLTQGQYRVGIRIKHILPDGTEEYNTIYEYFDPETYAWGISMDVTEVATDSIRYTVTSTHPLPAGTVTLKNQFTIQKRENNQWIDLEPLLGSPDMADSPLPRTKADGSIGWSGAYGDLPNGTYRLVRYVNRHFDNSETITRPVYAVFVIDSVLDPLGTAIGLRPPVKAELLQNDEIVLTLTEEARLSTLYQLIAEAKDTGSEPQTYTLSQDLLVLTDETGTQTMLQLIVEDDLIKLGDRFYDYGPGTSRDTGADNRARLYAILGVDAAETLVISHSGSPFDIPLGTATMPDTAPTEAQLLHNGETIAILTDEVPLTQLYDMLRNAVAAEPPSEDTVFDLEIHITMEDGTTRTVQATSQDDLYRIGESRYDYGPDDARETLFRLFGITWTDPEILALLRSPTPAAESDRLTQALSLYKNH